MRRSNHIRRINQQSNICGDYGHTRKDGRPCSNWVTPGTNACKKHKDIPLPPQPAPLVPHGVAVTLHDWGLKPGEWIDVHETFLRLIGLSVRRVTMLADLLAAISTRNLQDDPAWRAPGYVDPDDDTIDPDDPDETVERHAEKARGLGLTPQQLGVYKAVVGNVYAMSPTGRLYITHEEVRALTRLEAEERDRLGKLLLDAQKLGIEEKRVRIAEEQGGKLANVVRRMVEELNLNDEQMAEVGPAFRRALAAVFNEGTPTLEGIANV